MGKSQLFPWDSLLQLTLAAAHLARLLQGLKKATAGAVRAYRILPEPVRTKSNQLYGLHQQCHFSPATLLAQGLSQRCLPL